MLSLNFGLPPPGFGFVRAKTTKITTYASRVNSLNKIIAFRLDMKNLDSLRASESNFEPFRVIL